MPPPSARGRARLHALPELVEFPLHSIQVEIGVEFTWLAMLGEHEALFQVFVRNAIDGAVERNAFDYLAGGCAYFFDG